MTQHTSTTLRLIGAASLGGLLCLTAAPVWAQVSGHGYVGLNGGRSDSRLGTEAQASAGLAAGASLASFDADRRDNGFKAYAGWQFSPFLALEAGYFQLGEFGYRATTVPDGSVRARFQVRGLNLDLVGTLPITTNLSALARIGVQNARTRAEYDITGPVAMANRSQRKTDAKAGVGLQYDLGPMLVRAEVERYRVQDTMGSRVNVNMVSLGVVVPFGAAPAPAPRVVMAYPAAPPAPPAPATVILLQPPPAPAPVVAQAPPPPAPAPVAAPAPARTASFSAESLFGFDRSAVTAEGRQALDKFAQELAGTQYDRITVEGHTDRLGSTSYNQTLSQQRADAVKSYLVTTGRLDPMKIMASGKGESQPVTQAADCVGQKQTPVLIECLRSDRRVDIAVSATR